MKRSEILSAALKMINDAQKEYKIAYKAVGEQDKIKCDILHKIELNDDYDNRCKSATELKNCLKERSYYKDIVEETEPIVAFMESKECAKALNQMKELLGKLRAAESYHTNRSYRPRSSRK